MAAKAKAPASNAVAPRRVLEMMKEATGASDEDICVMLQLCGGDANEATEKLLESEFGWPSGGWGAGGRAELPWWHRARSLPHGLPGPSPVLLLAAM